MAVPGLDVGWLGRYDLTDDMGITAQFDDRGSSRPPSACQSLRRRGQSRGHAGREPRLHAAGSAAATASRLCDRRRGDAQRLPAGPRRAARGFLMRRAARCRVSLAGQALLLGASSRMPDRSRRHRRPYRSGAGGSRRRPAWRTASRRAARCGSRPAATRPRYGVCLFEDNGQCEEWALLRGQCPVGGIRITATSRRRRATARSAAELRRHQRAERHGARAGQPHLPGKSACDALALYEGRCPG